MSTPASNPTWLLWGRRLLWLGGVGAVAFVVLTLVLSRFLDPEALADRLEPRLEAALVRDVELGAVEVALFPLGVRLQDLVVADPTGLAPFLGRVESLELRVALIPLIRREVRISRLVLENPEADLRVAPGGRSNFGDFSTQASSATDSTVQEDGGFGLDLRGIRISGGQIRFENPEDSTLLQVQDLGLRASVRRDPLGPWFVRGESEADFTPSAGGDGQQLKTIPLFSSFDMVAGSVFESLEIRRGRVGVGEAALGITGRIDQLKDPVRILSLGLTGESLLLREIVAVLSDQLGFEVPGDVGGLVDAAFQVEGRMGPGETPEITGGLKVTRGGLEARDGTVAAQDLSFDLTLAGRDRVRFEIAGEVFDGPFSVEGSGDLGESANLSFEVRGTPDLALIQSVVEFPEGVAVQGRLDTGFRVNGSYRNLRSLRVWGDASPTAFQITHPDMEVPLHIPRGRISLVGNGATFVNLPVSLGEDDLTVTGEVQSISSYGLPYRNVSLRGTVRGPRLNLTQISTRTPPDPDLTYGKVAFAWLGDRTVAGRPPRDAAEELRLARPDSLPVVGELQLSLDTVIYAKGRMEDVRARMEFGPSLIRVTEASLRRFGGTVWASMNLSLGRRGQEPFNFSLQVRDLAAEEFLGATSPLGGIFRGRLSMDLDLVGTLDGLLLPDEPSLMGSGRFTLTEGALSSIPLTQSLSSFMGINEVREPVIQEWAASFVLADGRVQLANGRLDGALGDPIVGGSVGFGGELDLRSIFEIDADNLGRYALDNLGIHDDLAGRIPGRPGIVQTIISIGGTLVAPELHGDPGAMTQNLTQSVREGVQAETQRRVQEQQNRLQNRATGFLRNLLQPTNPAAGTIPDSVAGDSLRPDTVPPDTLRADSLRIDSIPGDTVRPDTTIPDTLRGDTLRPDTIPPDTLRISPPSPGPRR